MKGGHSHGYKALGRAFPENSVGWYRRELEIPEADRGRRIALEFDGVFRDASVFVNGFLVGHEPSGYASFQIDVSDYLKYGGRNVVAVRVDASKEEGWFYEGAGIYRHVWLTKTAPIHVAYDGTFVTSTVNGDVATVTGSREGRGCERQGRQRGGSLRNRRSRRSRGRARLHAARRRYRRAPSENSSPTSPSTSPRSGHSSRRPFTSS